MKVTGVKVYSLEQPLETKSFGFSQAWVTSRQTTMVVITTDEGIEGYGEAFGPTRVIAQAVETYCAPKVIGQDPFNTEVIWDNIYRPMRHNSQKGFLVEAMSGVDIALWDIKGKAAGVPVYKLLGGAFRDRATSMQPACIARRLTTRPVPLWRRRSATRKPASSP